MKNKTEIQAELHKQHYDIVGRILRMKPTAKDPKDRPFMAMALNELEHVRQELRRTTKVENK